MLCNNNGKASCGSTLVYCKARYSKAGQKKRKIIIRVYLDTDAELEWLEQITQAFRISPRGKRKKKKKTLQWHLGDTLRKFLSATYDGKSGYFVYLVWGYARFHGVEIIRGTIVKGMWEKVESGKKSGVNAVIRRIFFLFLRRKRWGVQPHLCGTTKTD